MEFGMYLCKDKAKFLSVQWIHNRNQQYRFDERIFEVYWHDKPQQICSGRKVGGEIERSTKGATKLN